MKMGWSKLFKTSNPETGKTTTAKVKTDDSGAVTDLIYGVERDKGGEKKHGHIFGLGPFTKDSKIKGRDQK